MRIASSYPLVKQTQVLEDERTPVADAKPSLSASTYRPALVSKNMIEWSQDEESGNRTKRYRPAPATLKIQCF